MAVNANRWKKKLLDLSGQPGDAFLDYRVLVTPAVIYFLAFIYKGHVDIKN